jgi:nucleotide-binding universal stress UspA family protein
VISTIVVGVDGSPAAEAAVRWAAELAHVSGARVIAVHAANLVERFRAQAPSEDEFEADLRRTVEAEWCGPLRQLGVLHEVVVQAGPAVETLLELAGGDPGALLVVGRRGTGLDNADLLGSTSRRLASEAPGAVVVVGAGEGTIGPGGS